MAHLDTLTVSQLRRVAGSLDIPGRWRMRRQELVAAITLARGQRGSTSSEPPDLHEVAATEAGAPAAEAVATSSEGPLREVPPLATELVAFPPALSAPGSPTAFIVPLPEAPAEVQASAPVEAPGPPEAHEVFIDRGPALPERYGRPRGAVMVQSKALAFVYWELDRPGAAPWTVRGLDAQGQTLHRFQTEDGPTGGFLHLPTALLAQVELRHPGLPEPVRWTLPAGASMPFATRTGLAPAGTAWTAAPAYPNAPAQAPDQPRWARPGDAAQHPASPHPAAQPAAPLAPAELLGPTGPDGSPVALPHSPVLRPLAG